MPETEIPQPGDNGDLSDVATNGAWHRAQGIAANNAVWDLLAAEPNEQRNEDLLRTAYAAAYHWQRASGARPENEARASYMIARALLATGQAEAALRAADRCLRVCTENGLVDFDLAYAYEVRARSLRALGRQAAAESVWALALAVPIADLEDAALLREDLAIDPVV
jgi:tetratricopeptide (TPR) repeat protein